MKLSGEEREESRGEGWEQGAEGPIRKGSQKTEEENGSRQGKLGDLEAEREKREWHRDEVRESWAGAGGSRGEPYGEGTGWQTAGHKMNGVSEQESGKWKGLRGTMGSTDRQGK